VFRRVYSEVKDTPFFRRRINATGRPQAHPLQKVVAAFRVLAYGEAADRAEEYVRLSRSTILLSVKCLVVCIVSKWESTYLRRPNNAELQTILDRNAERGFPGCMGSLDCSHWAWQQCPRGMAGSYQTRKGSRGIVVEAVCDEDLWIWHLCTGAPGSLNDINVMHQSSLYLDVTAGLWPPRNQTYTLSGTSRTPPYYLVDGIYPRYAFLMSSHPMPPTEEQKVFNGLQEAVRKDVERLFGVLTQRFHIALHPGRYRSVKMVLTFKEICTLQDMCVESRREGFLSRRKRAEGPNGGGVLMLWMVTTRDLGVRTETDLMVGQLAVAAVDMVVGRTSGRVLPPGELHLAAHTPAPTRSSSLTLSSSRQRAAWPPSLTPGAGLAMLLSTSNFVLTSPHMCGTTVVTNWPRTFRRATAGDIQRFFFPRWAGFFFSFILLSIAREPEGQSR